MIIGLSRLILKLLVCILGSWTIAVAAIWWWSGKDDALKYPDKPLADAIIVLGAAQYSGKPSPVLQARLDHALSLWKDKRAHYVVLTGGKREGDMESEAGAGKTFLSRNGVPDSVILYEDRGRTTLGSMQNASVILRGVDRKKVLLVSDPFHMLRLSLLARLHGMSPLVSPTRTSPISDNLLLEFGYAVRESLAIPADIFQFAKLKIESLSSISETSSTDG